VKELKKIWKWLLLLCVVWLAFGGVSGLLLWALPVTYLANLLGVRPYDVRYFIPYITLGLLWVCVAFIGFFKILDQACTSGWWGKLIENSTTKGS